MNATKLITTLRERGAVLKAQGDAIRIEAPRGTVTPELRDQLVAHKAELMVLLAGDPLGSWLSEPEPNHCEPPTDAPTVADLKALHARLAAYLDRGEAAFEAASPDAPRWAEAEQRYLRAHDRHVAIEHVIRALSGQRYSYERVARWSMAQAWRSGDMRALLTLTDAIGAYRARTDAAAPPEPERQERATCACGRTLAPWEPTPDGTCSVCTNGARDRAGLPPLVAKQDGRGGWTWCSDELDEEVA